MVTADDVKSAQQASADAAPTVDADKKALADAKAKSITDQGQASTAELSVRPKLTEKATIDKALVLYLSAKLTGDQTLANAAKARA
jgi:hypothetical protein